MILATMVMLFQIQAVAPAAMPPQQPQTQVILAENETSSNPVLRTGDATDTAKSTNRPSPIDHDNLRMASGSVADAKILASNDPVKMLGVDNEAQVLASVQMPAHAETQESPLDGPKTVRRPSKAWHVFSAPRKLQGLIQGR